MELKAEVAVVVGKMVAIIELMAVMAVEGIISGGGEYCTNSGELPKAVEEAELLVFDQMGCLVKER